MDFLGIEAPGFLDSRRACDQPPAGSISRPLYFGTLWFLPSILLYYGLRDRLRL